MGDIEGSGNWILLDIEEERSGCGVISDPRQLIVYFFNSVYIAARFIKDKVREGHDLIG